MKKLFFAIVFAVSAVFTAAIAGNMFDWVAYDSQAVIRFDAAELLKRPEAVNFLNSSEAMAKQLAFSSKTGCDIKDLQKAVLCSGGNGKGTLVLKFGKKIDLPAALKGLGADFATSKTGKYTIYTRDERSSVCQLADDLIAFGAQSDLKALITEKRGLPAEFAKFAPANGSYPPVWAAFDIEGVTGTASCTFTGKDNLDQLLSAGLIFKNGEKAQQFVAMVPMYAGMFSGMLFSGAPELGAKLMQSFKVSNSGNNVNMSLLISRALADEIAGYLNEFGKNMSKTGVPAAK